MQSVGEDRGSPAGSVLAHHTGPTLPILGASSCDITAELLNVPYIYTLTQAQKLLLQFVEQVLVLKQLSTRSLSYQQFFSQSTEGA